MFRPVLTIFRLSLGNLRSYYKHAYSKGNLISYYKHAYSKGNLRSYYKHAYSKILSSPKTI